MKNKILYIENDSLDVYFNFALEYYLTTEKTFEDYTVLLFWRTSPTLMVGKYQNTLEEINRAYVEKRNINVVRRLSGGGTIYTDQGGWQYSFITRDQGLEIQFEEYIGPVISALRGLGIDAAFNGRNDLVIGDRKFSGNAQYRQNGFVVHHGSLLYGTDLEEMIRSTTVAEYKIISKGIQSVRERVTNISDHMASPLAAGEFSRCMIDSLLGEQGERYRLQTADMIRIKEIARDSFGNWDCIYGKNPNCSIVKHGQFEGGSVEFHLNVEKGIISQANIYGDFFGVLDPVLIERALISCPYEKQYIDKALEVAGIDRAIYKISRQQLVDLIVSV